MPETLSIPASVALGQEKEGPVSKSELRATIPAVILPRRENAVPPLRPEAESAQTVQQVENEFLITPRVSVQADIANLTYPKEFDNKPNTEFLKQAYARSMMEQFNRLSATMELEVNSPRTEIIQQQIVNKMTEGSGLKTRVVIMNKGEALRAFVVPDGTIFISQSLLNTIDTLDELGGVLGHEIGHLVFKTSSIRATANEIKDFGVGWIHESACDGYSKIMLEKAGLNTLAFSSAIEKVSGYERGTIHQGGIARASMSVGAHYFVDSRTSHLPQQPLPDILKKEKPQKTNLEIVKEQIKNQISDADLKISLAKLYPTDLKDILGVLNDHKLIYDKENRSRLRVCTQLIYDRLTDAGYPRGEAVLAVIGLKKDLGYEGINFFNPEEVLPELTKNLGSLENNNRRLQIHRTLFSSSDFGNFVSPLNPLLNGLATQMTNSAQDLAKNQALILVNDESILNFLKAAQTLPAAESHQHIERNKLITRIICNYLKFFILKDGDEQTLIAARNFLINARDLRVSIDPKSFSADFDVSKDFNKKVVDLAFEAYGIEEEKPPGFKEVDDFFDKFLTLRTNASDSQIPEASELGDFARGLREYFREKKITDENRAQLLVYIAQKIDGANFQSQADLLRYLEGEPFALQIPPEKNTPEFQVLQENLIKFNLKLNFGVYLFEKDGDEFYDYFQNAMVKSGINTDDLSQIQLLNLCRPLFRGDSNITYFGSLGPRHGVSSSVRIDQIDRLSRLPFIDSLIKKTPEKLTYTTVKELSDYTKAYFSKIEFLRSINQKNEISTSGENLFDDSISNLVISQNIIQNFQELISKDIPESEFGDIYEFVSSYYPEGPGKQQILKEINKKYLNSDQVTFDEKVNYLIVNFNRVGIEGMVILAEQITDINTYRQFRKRMGGRMEQYLEGAPLVSAVALGDFASSTITDRFASLLETTSDNPEIKKSHSQYFATTWFQKIRDIGFGKRAVEYDQANQKFTVSSVSRGVFRSIKDTFESLKGLSPVQKFALAHKALTESNGAFSSEDNRKTLSRIFLGSLDLQDGFVKSVLKTAILKADAKFITFPVANMLSQMLFKSLDHTLVDINELSKSSFQGFGNTFLPSHFTQIGQVLSEPEIEKIVNSTTREITMFAPDLQKEPGSAAALLAKNSDDRYFAITTKLQDVLGIRGGSGPESGEAAPLVDPALETIIRGVESSGPLGIRALQLATQFFRFPPEIHKRLSESFDANTGMNKLMFWENLNKLSLDELNGKGESGVPSPAIEEFITRVKLGRHLGGGSLQTTRAAQITEDGQVREIILKLKNPNTIAFVQEAYKISKGVLDEVVRTGTGEEQEYARIGLMMIDLARKWCIADINDKTFERDDDIFRGTIDSYNGKLGYGSVSVPERVFTHPKLKSEDLAPGRTANQVLNDETVSGEVKKDVVWTMAETFLHQLRVKTVDADGKAVYVVHSDPHIGNIMVDNSGEDLREGVIDRSMFLNLTEKDVKVLDKLIREGNINDFAYSFVGHILDINKIRGLEKIRLTGGILKNLGKEYLRQVARGKVDKFVLLQTLFSEFSKSRVNQIDIPLELRLMIRNIAAFQELTLKYGISLDEIDRSMKVAA